MVGVEVGNRNRIHFASIDSQLYQAGVGGRPAVEKDGTFGGSQENGRLASTAGAEGVTGSDEGDVGQFQPEPPVWGGAQG